MKKYMFLSLLTALVIGFAACDEDDDKDMTPPVITDRGIVASPINCQVYHPGDTIFFRYLFEDNQELGNFNIEVHGNFDHHSHSTEADDHDHDHDGGECEDHDDHDEHDAEEGGEAWVFNQTYSIPAGLQTYAASESISVPAGVKHGDYHFMVRLTDSAGWQQLKAVAIRIE
jgi:hypothetical protein